VVEKTPLDALLIETDAPFLAPAPNRGRRNEPAFVRYTAEAVAEVKGLPVEEVAAATTENARRLFGLSARGKPA
jgi:TatD DNase family protein